MPELHDGASRERKTDLLWLLGLQGSAVWDVTVWAVMFTVVEGSLGIGHDEELLDVALREREIRRRWSHIHQLQPRQTCYVYIVRARTSAPRCARTQTEHIKDHLKHQERRCGRMHVYIQTWGSALACYSACSNINPPHL